MGCGASSAAGDKAIVSATRIDPKEDERDSVPQKAAERPPTEASVPQEKDESPANDAPSSRVEADSSAEYSATSQAEPSNQAGPQAPSKPLQNTDAKQEELDSGGAATKSAPKEAVQQNGPESGGASPAEKIIDGSQVTEHLANRSVYHSRLSSCPLAS